MQGSRTQRKLNNPTPEQIKKSRLNAGLTQAQAAAVIHKKLLAWQRYESGDRSMDCALYELFLLKTGQIDIGQCSKLERGNAVDIASSLNQR